LRFPSSVSPATWLATSAAHAGLSLKLESRSAVGVDRDRTLRGNTSGIDFLSVASRPATGALGEKSFRARLGRSVKTARIARGLTQRELSELVGIAEKYLSRLELGMATPSVLIALRLAGALRLDVEQLAWPGRRVTPTLTAIARLLRKQPEQELDRARRILAELFR
jgi:putative transcriptional regulator